MMYVVTNFKNREFRKTIIKLTWIHQVSLTFEKFSGYSKVWAEKKSTSVYYSSEKKPTRKNFVVYKPFLDCLIWRNKKMELWYTYIHTYNSAFRINVRVLHVFIFNSFRQRKLNTILILMCIEHISCDFCCQIHKF